MLFWHKGHCFHQFQILWKNCMTQYFLFALLRLKLLTFLYSDIDNYLQFRRTHNWWKQRCRVSKAYLMFCNLKMELKVKKIMFETLHNHNFFIYRWILLIVNNHKHNWSKVQANKLHTSCKFIHNKKENLWDFLRSFSCSWRWRRMLKCSSYCSKLYSIINFPSMITQ